MFVKGPPHVCTICAGTDHVKSECVKLFLPNMFVLPEISKHWSDLLSQVCQKITGTITQCVVTFDILYQVMSFADECKMTNEDTEQRETILAFLEKEFRKIYPHCRVYPTGSFKNGFGFRQSDLDICVQLETNVGFEL